MIAFQYPVLLWGLLLAVPLTVLFILVIRWKARTRREMGDPDLIAFLTRGYSPARYFVKFLVIVFAILCCVLAAANLRKPRGSKEGKRAGIDVILVLDVSKSMLSTDVKPSRLERAKQLMQLLTDRLQNDRVGLVLFAGQAVLQMPLTPDVSAAHLFISNAGVNAVPTQGTVIGDALQVADHALDTKEKKYKAVVLISDGEDHDPESEKQAAALADHGVVVYTVGIGTPEGSPITEPGSNDYKRDAEGRTVISKLDEKSLQQVSSVTGGKYFRLSSVEDASAFLSGNLDSMEKKGIGGGVSREYEAWFPFLIALALLLLVIEPFIPEVRRAFRRVPALAVLLFAPFFCFSQKPLDALRQGNDQYRKGELDKAAESYKRSLSADSSDPRTRYNLGNALERQKKYEEAALAYGDAAPLFKSDSLRASSFYNRGVALTRRKELKDAIENYKSALRLTPADNDARENLQKAINELKKQQEQKQPPPKQNPNQRPEDQKKKNRQPPPQSNNKLTQQQAQQLLDRLRDNEKQLQKQLQKQRVPNSKQEKDW